FFFFQAEDGIRDFHVTGVQTCALPISYIHGAIIWFWHMPYFYMLAVENVWWHALEHLFFLVTAGLFWWAVLKGSRQNTPWALLRSEERRVGKGGRYGGSEDSVRRHNSE